MNDTDNRFANLSDVEFKNAATYAAMMIERHGFVYVTLSPGDGTRYEISLASPPTGYQHDRYKFWTRDGETQPLTFQQRFSGTYFVATHLRMYRWEGTELGDWGYVHEKWTAGRAGTDEWTARVLHRFLNELAPLLPARPAVQP